MDRRAFLGTSLLAGAGAAALAGGSILDGGQAWAAQDPSAQEIPLVPTPPAPTGHRQYVTRPDLRPPAVTVSKSAGFPYASNQPKYIFVAPRVSPGGTYPKDTQPGLMILDLDGNLVWFQSMTGADESPFNFQVQTYKGKPVLMWFRGSVTPRGWATGGEYVIADDTYSVIHRVTKNRYPPDLHESFLTSEGTLIHTAYETRVKDSKGALVTVGHAQEVDVATGKLVFDWACYPHVAPTESYTGTNGDYFHMNSIDLWPGSARDLLISGRNTCAVYLVDRQTKAVKWRLGGKASTWTMGPGTRFYYQHDARALKDGSGISVFDDASAPGPEKTASGKVLGMDQKTHRARLRHQYLHTDGEFNVPSQGNLQLLSNGGHMVGWGALPYFSVYRPSGTGLTGEMELDGRFPTGVETYRAFMFNWTGRPKQDELRLVVRRTGTGNHFTAWVSWNGATDVAAWRLNAGPSSHSLEVIKTVKKESFETAINFTRAGAKAFQVAALDSSGRVISRTKVASAG